MSVLKAPRIQGLGLFGLKDWFGLLVLLGF